MQDNNVISRRQRFSLKNYTKSKKVTKFKKIAILSKSLFVFGFVIIINGIVANIIFNKVISFIKDIIIILFLNTFCGDIIF